MAIASLTPDLELRGAATAFTAALQNGRVALTGPLDIASVESLRIVLDQVLLESREQIRIDAARGSVIDVSANSQLLRCHMPAAAQHRRI
jgi:hypothetical protein